MSPSVSIIGQLGFNRNPNVLARAWSVGIKQVANRFFKVAPRPNEIGGFKEITMVIITMAIITMAIEGEGVYRDLPRQRSQRPEG